MTKISMRPVIALIAAVGVLAACAPRTSPAPASESFTAQLQAVSDAVAGVSGYSKEAIEVTGNRMRLRIEVVDQTLATADQVARETKAVALVSAAERAMAAQPDLGGIQAVSVAILHSSDAGSWHVEDVIDFRKGPGGSFSIHGPS
jgi:hypothetical protein